ncbi:MAG: ubiquitin-like domain-containing protein [Candidatus Saccharimonadales bacterium]
MTKKSLMYLIGSPRALVALVVALIACVSGITVSYVYASQPKNGERFVTIHDRGLDKVIFTKAKLVGDALADANISLDSRDTVEPKSSETLVGNQYQINIYRARPVIVTDGVQREKVMTPYQTANKIASNAGVHLYDEDTTRLIQTDDIVTEGASLELVITRATPLTFIVYSKPIETRTQGTTVGDMLKQKNITLGADDFVSVPLDTPITAGMTVALSRNGAQTVTVDDDIPFTSEKVYDTARPVGYHDVQVAGVKGSRTITYEIVMEAGKEISRKEIQTVVTKEPTRQIEIIGLKTSGLSRSKGANMFTDSKGVMHRETYYDLAMNVVMQSCGGGSYTVRPDGAKVDKDGYILVAAHLGNYPRCSVVETSMGLGKVYDTGGFAARHPHGFDLATDWTNNDGR